MSNNLLDLVNNIDFSAMWQWFTNLPLIPKIVGILPPLGAIIALIVNLPKAYSLFRGIVVKLEVKRFSLVERVSGLVDFQLDLCIYASHGNAVLKGIYLKNNHEFHLLYNEPICLYNEPDNNAPSNQAIVKLAVPKTDSEFTQSGEDKFKELFSKKLKQSQVDILGFQVPENSFKCLTMAGRLKGKIIDGENFSNIPLKDWSVLVTYGNRKTEKVLIETIIDNNQTLL